jgi:ribonuclease BN (tRNA processing enzyme)
MSVEPSPDAARGSEIIALGTGGWIPTSVRQTSCYLVRAGTQAMLLDAGSGFGQLTLNPQLLQAITDVTIVLSHFHLDHVEGLGMINDLNGSVTVAGPGQVLYDVPTKELLSRFLDRPFKTSNPLRDARVVDLDEGDVELNGWQICCRRQLRHTVPSMGFRVGDDFAYITDTEYDEGSVRFAAGVRWLLHEAWGVRTAERGHTSGLDAGRIACDAQVGGLYLTHLNPAIAAEDVLTAARDEFPETFLPSDGQTLFTTPTLST